MRIFIAYGIVIGIFLTTALSGCGGTSGPGGTAESVVQTQTMVAGGGQHTLILKQDGTVWTWGDNSSGQLGKSIPVSQASPESPVLTDVALVAAGGAHSLALKRDGTVWGWGDSRYGQAGDPSPISSPITIVTAGSITLISPYYNAGNSSSPLSIPASASITLTSGDYDTGTVAGGNLQIWNSTNPSPLIPGSISHPAPIVLLPPPPCITFPRQIPGLSAIVAVAAGTDHSLALKSDGTVWSWGRNSSGQLGVTTTGEYSAVPVKAICPDGMTAIAAGAGHSVALRKDGTVWAWGDGTYGQAGGGTGGTSLPPRLVTGLEGVIAIASGSDHILALTRDGSLWAWGRNSHGQIGDNSTADRAIPVRIALPESVLKMAGGGNHSVALMSSGRVWVWGDNATWQGGGASNEEAQIPTPRLVAGVDSLKAVAAGESNTLVLKDDGTFLGWGNNVSGQLGDGTRGYRRRPVVIGAARTGTIIEGSDWGGRDLTPCNGDILSGTFTNVGRFAINSEDAVGYGPGELKIYAASIDIYGSLYGIPQGISYLTLSADSINLRAGSIVIAFSVAFSAGESMVVDKPPGVMLTANIVH